MALSRVRMRRAAVALVTVACVFAGALPAVAGPEDGGRKGHASEAPPPRDGGEREPAAAADREGERGRADGLEQRERDRAEAREERERDRADREGPRARPAPAGVAPKADAEGDRDRADGVAQRERDRADARTQRQRDRADSGRERERDRGRDGDRNGSRAGAQAVGTDQTSGSRRGGNPSQPAGGNGGEAARGDGDAAGRAPARGGSDRVRRRGERAGGGRRSRRGGGRRERSVDGLRDVSGVAPLAPLSLLAPAPSFSAPVITNAGGAPALAPLGSVGPAGADDDPGAGEEGSRAGGPATGFRAEEPAQLPPVTRTVREIVEVVPGPVKAALAALLLLALALATHSYAAGARARRLARQRERLLDEVGLLQAALLPSVPRRLGDLVSTVAYRPAEGPAAGGDFYDAFAFDGGRVGVIVGDIAGHGREALARTALIRYTLRAYLDAGLEPRAALKVAGSVLEDDLAGDFATVVLAVYDPATGTLTYASAGHPPPILLGPPAHEPVTACSSPPIGAGATTGLRQTTIALPPGSIACFFTDGMTEARIGEELLGRERLAELLAGLGPRPTARQLLERVAEAVDRTPDDMAACILRADGQAAGTLRIEELEVALSDVRDGTLERFLRECGIPVSEIVEALMSSYEVARQAGSAVLRVRLGDWRPGVDVLPANVEQIAARRAASLAG